MSSDSSNMPYNTRRKSVSLQSLGIHIPGAHASRAAARVSPPSTTPTPTTENAPASAPAKKLKRSHEDSPSMSPPPKRVHIKYEHTPPPSPEAESDDLDQDAKSREIDIKAIGDDIVEGVVIQLQSTGNRPHLVKELAAILSQSVKIVQQSANPSAIISSRLSTYLKRPWTKDAPCPVAKELETVHPRRTYFYLTTYPHQPIPDPATAQYNARAFISPSISSQSDDAESRRRDMSPSPEVDLSAPEFDHDEDIVPAALSGSFSDRSRHAHRNTRATSPPLEKDEKEFTQTARGMQRRKLSSDTHMDGVPSEMGDHPTKHSEAETLFGEGRHLNVANSVMFISSPAMKPVLSINILKRPFEESHDLWGRFENTMDWDMRSPENVELEELDVMFDDL